MSDQQPSKATVYFIEEDDRQMQEAFERARQTFRYFWRELSWERRRIVPGLGLACVKVPFADPPGTDRNEDGPACEQMWLSDVDFDGEVITGTLINSPQWLSSIEEGDEAEVPLNGMTDWMYTIHDRVYGAYTVNLMRSRMARGERAQHDDAWGLDFGDPYEIEVVPKDFFGQRKGGWLKRLFGGHEEIDVETAEHPMSENMAESFEQFLKEDPANAHSTDENGWTMLHQLALAGSAAGVAKLLEHGADPNALTNKGQTPLRLANTLGWTRVVELLTAHGAKQ